MAIPSNPATPEHGAPPVDDLPVPEAFRAPISQAPATQPPAAPQTTPATPPPAAASQPVVLGDRTFSSMAEAQEFLNSQMAIAARVIQSQPAPAAQPQEVNPADLIFEDPNTAIKLIKQQVRDEINQANSVQSERARIETEFYTKYEDLSQHRDYVQFKTRQLMATRAGFDKLSTEKVFEIVAAESRSDLAKIRGSAANGQPLPDRPAVVAGGGGAATPVPAAIPAQPSSFIGELNAARAKRVNQGR